VQGRGYCGKRVGILKYSGLDLSHSLEQSVGKILKKIQRLIHDESGQGMVEYILVSVAVVAGCYFLMWVLSELLVRNYNEIAAHVCLPIP